MISRWCGRSLRGTHNCTDEFIDRICEIVNQSPHLEHLSIIKSDVHYEQDTSFSRLTRKVSSNKSALHLKSLHLALWDLELDRSTLLHLRSLTTLHVEGSAQASSTGQQLWSAFAAANIHLQSITIWHLSKPLLDYLQTYSSLQRLHLKLMYYPDGDWSGTEFDRQVFMQQILPLHNLSPTFSAPSKYDPALTNEGLLFTRHSMNLAVLPQWDVTVCTDSGPHFLPLLVSFHAFQPVCVVLSV